MAVTVTHLPNGTWQVNFPEEDPVILPANSWMEDVRQRGRQYGNAVTFLEFEFEQNGGRIMFYDPGQDDREIMPDEEEDGDMAGERERAFEQLEDAWLEAGGPDTQQPAEAPPVAQAQAEGDPEEEEEARIGDVPRGGRRKNKTHRNKKASRRSRLQKQTRRAKRNTRNNKRRKLRKLTTRRR
jgi:hypothetical protein